MKPNKILITLFAVACFAFPLKAQTNVQTNNYKVFYASAKRFGQPYMVLRSFENHNRLTFLLVNPQTLQTGIDEAAGYEVKPLSMQQARTLFKNSPYQKALSKAESQSVAIQDAGIETGLPSETGISLTADLCPSHRPLDKRIFTDIINSFKKVKQPVPIALSVSGIWMRQHPQDLEWLKQLQEKHDVSITWINHSFNHRVSAKAPLKENFLLEPGTDINFEVLETEKAMIRNNLLPSVFFRFPGLVSDQQLVYRITDFGLIPIGTDAWLAKGQQPHAGSIVLIHGNGNEPTGVNDFIKLLNSKTASIAGKQWLLYDLRETIDEEFERN